MSEMLRAGIVRIFRESDQQVVGVGFLVDAEKKIILTCAHVINAAIGKPDNQDKPRALIGIDFPFLAAGQRIDARATAFFPKTAKASDDVAVLEIVDALPAQAKAVRLVVSASFSGDEFGVYGFPRGFEESGQYVEGKLQERLTNKRIQAVGTTNLGYFVEGGFSGSPLFDKQHDAVVGMMMQVDVEADKRVAFISSIDVLALVFSGLKFDRVERREATTLAPTASQSTGKWLQRVDIFISSPSDVAEEREAILRVIERLNRLSSIRRRYVLNPLLYEKEVPPEAGDHAQMIVDRYMAVEDSYLLVCLMWNRMGTPFTHPKTGEEFQSGTEYEFTIGYRANGKSGQPHLLLYRKTTEQAATDKSERDKVDTFFKQFEGKEATFKGLYKHFSSLGEFENMLFEHIERILHDNPPDADSPDNRVDPDTRPDIIEEVRRLDAAMPRECFAGKSTEVRVMICLPQSEGLKALLPDYTIEGDLIGKADVRAGNLAVGFPVDRNTGRPKHIIAGVEVKSNDIDFDEGIQEIQLFPNTNSGLLVFSGTPLHANSRSRVHVVVKSRTVDGYTVILGAASLDTTVVERTVSINQGGLGATIWKFLSIPLSAYAKSEHPGKFVVGGNAIGSAIGDSAVVVAAPITDLPNIARAEDLLSQPFGWIQIPLGKVTLHRHPEAVATFHVEAFAIAKYPITNAQFAIFVEAGGYRERKWWTEAGWHYREREKWIMPRYWTDSKWNRREQPVVGISWYEAVAFCMWLNNATGQRITLPTEPQWQYAAQGFDARKYPWGDTWDVSRCNVDFETTTPVRQYEGQGDSPFGVTDMVGNTWEWCLTSYGTGSNDVASLDARVIRGGAWTSYEPPTVDLRHYMQVDMYSNYVGFRIVMMQD